MFWGGGVIAFFWKNYLYICEIEPERLSHVTSRGNLDQSNKDIYSRAATSPLAEGGEVCRRVRALGPAQTSIKKKSTKLPERLGARGREAQPSLLLGPLQDKDKLPC